MKYNKDMPATGKEGAASFALTWAEFENVIGKNYLDVLNQAIPISSEIDFDSAFDLIQMNHIVRIVYDRQENTLAKLNNLYSALNLSGASVFILLQNATGNTELYLGVCGTDANNAGVAQQVLENSFIGNFPGVLQEPIISDENCSGQTIQLISDRIRECSCIASVTGVPSIKEDTAESFSQGLEKFIDSLGDRNYSAVFLATPVNRLNLLELEQNYQRLYSDLSLLNISQISLSEQESISLGQSISNGLSESISQSVSVATAQTYGSSETKTDGETKSLGSTIAGAGAAAGAALGTWVFPGVGTLAGAAIGGGIGAAVGGLLGSTNHSNSTTTTKSSSESKTETNGSTTTTSTTTTATETLTDTKGQAYSYDVKNRRVSDAMRTIEEQLERIRGAKNYGAWNWAAYFTAHDIETVRIGSEVYSGILRGEKTGVEHCSISYWVRNKNNTEAFESIIRDISCFKHPRFNLDQSGTREIIIAPTALLNTQEMAAGMALPQKSIPGLPVFESVEFGRSVTTYDKKKNSRECQIGLISHFGSSFESNPVRLDIDSLTAHTFVTGSTGSGKSNAVYTILSKLKKEYDIPYLVIEPTKGEYKQIFSDVKVFGTNPYLTELLRINPFSFPLSIHVTEHIDRLIEILNAVWPMYAAMPAILKEAVELTYRKCGWDLLTSKNKFVSAVFPDFTDLLDTLPAIIEASKYSEEVKSNYAGSLLTRVKSLTNGYYRNIFTKDELSVEVLFDQSCIIDLSRVGSSETKSMLMGIVFLKLQEYRLCKAEQQNSKLRHITVLEEAHNLLRRTSTDQNQESANLQGKAVEMITNAIAEMRTYGEGFIIADQAPGLLDESVIRNTNTKIVLRLPDFDDRLLVGKAENLSDAQIEELARLKTGCASIYQNNWQEAALCQIDKFEGKQTPFKFNAPSTFSDSRAVADEYFLQVIAQDLETGSLSLSTADISILQKYYPQFVAHYNDRKLTPTMVLKFFGDFIALADQIKTVKNINDPTEWTRRLVSQIFTLPMLEAQDPCVKDQLLRAVFRLLELQNSKQKEIWRNEVEHFEKWRKW